MPRFETDPGATTRATSRPQLRKRALPTMCILAGGLGTRLGDRAHGLPKPLVEVAGQPFLLHQLQLLARAGFENVVLCVGFKGELVEDIIGHDRWGVTISYSYDGAVPCGTLQAIRQARTLLGDQFLYMYGDTYLNIDYREVVDRWHDSGLPAMMTVLHNRGEWGLSNVLVTNGRIIGYDKDHPTPDMEWIDYGLGGLTIGVLDAVSTSVSDLSGLHTELAGRERLCAVQVDRRFYEIGTPESLEEAEEHIVALVAQRINRDDVAGTY